MTKIAPAVEEAVDTLDLPAVTRRRLLAGGGLASASLAASALLAACSRQPAAAGGVGQFPSTPQWNFVFVNHVTTNTFFVPTQAGADDACKLLGCRYQWNGSQNSVVAEMVNQFNTAISARADGIALAVTDENAFRSPVDSALSAGIPVVSYNADGAPNNPGTNRLAYIGQSLFESGRQLGLRLASLMQGGGDVVGFIATPGALNIQPRIDGAKQALQQSGKQINFQQVASGADEPTELSTIQAYLQAHQNLKGVFAVDGGSTASVGQAVQQFNLKSKGVVAGGFDLEPKTLQGVKDGHLDFTIDQQPYLQGFLPVLYLYLWKLSGGLVVPPETNTGLSFVTKDNVDPYLNTQTRFEGSSQEQKVVDHTGPIGHR